LSGKEQRIAIISLLISLVARTLDETHIEKIQSYLASELNKTLKENKPIDMKQLNVGFTNLELHGKKFVKYKVLSSLKKTESSTTCTTIKR
jgi:hypothetical protein